MATTIIALLISTALLVEPSPVPKPPSPGGSCPHGYIESGSSCVPARSVADAIAKPVNGTCPWGSRAVATVCAASPVLSKHKEVA
jgi:hypothetical protein